MFVGTAETVQAVLEALTERGREGVVEVGGRAVWVVESVLGGGGGGGVVGQDDRDWAEVVGDCGDAGVLLSMGGTGLG